MAFPVTPPALTQEESINVIIEAEASIAQCMADFLCNTILPNIALLTDVNDQVELSKTIYCAYSSKENSIANVLEGIASITLADKGLVPGGTDDTCKC